MLWFFAGRQVTPMRAPSLARVRATPSGGSSNSRPDLSEAGERTSRAAKAPFCKKMRKGELIQECEKRGLSTVGTKAVLLGRLQDCDETVYMAKQAGGVKPMQPVDKEVEVQKEAESGSNDENPKPAAMEAEKAAVAKKSQEEALLGELSAVLSAEEELMAQSMALEQEDDMTPALKKAEIALQQVVALKAEDDARSEAALQKAAERLTEKTMASLQRSADGAAEPKVPRDMVIAGRRITVSVRPLAKNATFPGLVLLSAASHVTSVFGSFWKSVRNTLAPPDQEKMDAGAMVLAFALVASLML